MKRKLEVQNLKKCLQEANLKMMASLEVPEMKVKLNEI